MRRIVMFFLTAVLLGGLALGVSAATGATAVTGVSSVDANGSCQMSLTVVLHLEQATDKLYFPVPRDATGVLLNGARVSTSRKGDARQVDLSRLTRQVVGDVTVHLQYTLRNVIYTTEAGLLEMRVPLLSGFDYPVQHMDFSVTVPHPVEVLPGFVSGYHQARIEEYLTYGVQGTTVSGSTLQPLKDHETLTMTMSVTQEQFPRSLAQTQDYSVGQLAMYICAALALVYWVIAMWNRPGFAKVQTQPPAGYHAGSLGSLLAMQGLDLTMLVFTWAQLGYVLIYVKGQRVTLYKQMEMGNERSELELRCFRKLFAKGDRVNTWELRYAQLCQQEAKAPQLPDKTLRRFNGSPTVFRVLSAGIGLFGGGCMAVALADGAALQGVLLVLFALLGGISGWYIQLFGVGLLLQKQRLLRISLGLSLAWLLLSLLAQAVTLGLVTVGLLLLSGILLAWGGRRTPVGRLLQMQTVGFSRYLHKVSPAQLQRICRSDPEYFFRLAPAALALGREKIFAKRFGALRLDRCPYLTTGMDGHMTALQWAALMRRAADAMEDRANRLPLERTIRLLRSITRR